MRILFISLGCDKNRVDSEIMLGLLGQAGHTFTDDVDEAEAAIVNTCCFIGDAKKESVDTLLELADRRAEGMLSALIVTGCLAQRYQEEILTQIPEVDAVLGLAAEENIAETLAGIMEGTAERLQIGPLDQPPLCGERLQTTGGHYNYLRIAEGCEKNCTYCILPQIRGRYRSVPMERLVDEAARLAGEGVTELILVAQETTLYGVDLYGHKELPELLHRLAGIEGLRWIRLLYCYPEEIDDALLDAFRTEPKVCHYLDIPIQSGSDTVLRRMGRRTDSAQIRAVIRHIRERIPDICIRTTLIAGFPGETPANQRETLALVQELRFDRLGVFAYSQEEGTPAAQLEGQCTELTKARRRGALMRAQQEVTFALNEALVGQTCMAVIEGRLVEPGDVYVARTWRDAPDIDGYLFIEHAPVALMSGQYVQVRVTAARGYDLVGELMDEQED